MCLKVLPSYWKTNNSENTAQHAGLTDIVLRDMVLFPIVPNFTRLRLSYHCPMARHGGRYAVSYFLVQLLG
jgi:hypothetical protein